MGLLGASLIKRGSGVSVECELGEWNAHYFILKKATAKKHFSQNLAMARKQVAVKTIFSFLSPSQ